MALLKVANLKKSYNITKTQKQDVLKGIDIEFKSGDLVALLGESGCGKSTLINILGGLDTDYTGSVIIKNEFIRDFSEKQMDDYRKKRIGLIFQNYNLISHLTIKENIKIAMTISDIDEKTAETRAIDLLKLVGLSNFANKYPNQLSGGQKQRVAIARALANNPTIIFADEPTGALDAESADLVMMILKKIAESGKLVVIVTHSEKIASECGRIVKMEDGKIVSDITNKKLHVDTERDKEITPKNIKNKELAKMSINNVKQSKSRSLLVSFGLAIGMAAVLLILCLSSGLANYIDTVYTQNLYSLQMSISKNNYSTISDSEISTINELSGVENTISSYISNSSTYSYNSSTGNINKLEIYYDNYQPNMLYGEIKEDSTDNYIIVNKNLAETLKTDSLLDCISQSISITIDDTTKTYVISGIFEDNISKKNELCSMISKNSMLDLLDSTEFDCNILYLTATDSSYVSAIQDDITSLGLSFSQEENESSSILKYVDIGTTVLSAVAAISMVVSAIMIFIVLYIAVSERTKEIGIMRAVGARKKDIRKLFIFEAGIIGLVAGLLAVSMCLLVTVLTNIIFASSLGCSLISYNILYYALGIIVSIIISILAGIAPSFRASDLDPVECLRAE